MSSNVRKYTLQLMEMVDEGILTYEQVALAALRYMSEDEVREMAEANELLPEEEDDDEV